MNQPFDDMRGPPPPGMHAARDAVNVVGVLLISWGALQVITSLLGILFTLLMGTPAMNSLMGGLGLPKELSDLTSSPEMGNAKLIRIATNSIGLLLGGLMVLGGFHMRNLKNYGLSIAACIAAIVPLGCCCFIGIGLGVWGLVTLTRAEIKSAFT